MTEWHEYIWKMRPEHLAFVMLIACLIPTFFTLGIPIPPGYLSTDYFNSVESIPTGGIVVIGANIYDIGGYHGHRDLWGTQFYHWVRKGLKIICVVLDTTSQIAFIDVFRRYGLEKGYGGTYEYGKDFMITPFIPGEETAMARFAADIWGTCAGRDWYGTSLTELPLMANIRSFADVHLTTFKAYSGTHIEMAIRQWSSANFPNVKLVATHAFEDLAYAYGTRVMGTISGTRGNAEYAYMVRAKYGLPFTNEEVIKIEGRVTEGLLMWIAIAVGFVHLQIERQRRAAPKVKEEARA